MPGSIYSPCTICPSVGNRLQLTVVGGYGATLKQYTIFGLLRGTTSHFQRFPRELGVHLPFTFNGA